MNKKKSLISVIIPVRNRPAKLRRLLFSLRAQTLPDKDYEVVVCDDGSSDNTLQIAQQCSVKCVRNNGTGRSVARNTAIDASSGEIILFLDSDCIASTYLLEKHLSFHQNSNPDFFKHNSGSALLGGVDFPPHIQPDLITRYSDIPSYLESEQKLLTPSKFLTCNLSIPKELIVKNGAFNEKFSGYGYEDIELGWRLMRKGNVRLYQDISALVWHLNRRSPEDWVRTAYEAGEASVKLFRLHPESADELKLPAFEALDLKDENVVLDNLRLRRFKEELVQASEISNSEKDPGAVHEVLHKIRVYGAANAIQKSVYEKTGNRDSLLFSLTGNNRQVNRVKTLLPRLYASERSLDNGFEICLPASNHEVHMNASEYILTSLKETSAFIRYPISGRPGWTDTFKACASIAKAPYNIYRAWSRGRKLSHSIYFETVDKIRRVIPKLSCPYG